MKIQKIKAFTLIEMMTSILIVAIILIWAFEAMTSLGFWKIRLIQKTATQKQMLYFSEKLFEMIKYWGTIDFEEYFNRKVVDNTTYSSWHYAVATGYWNYGPAAASVYWSWYYYCISWNIDPMGTDWCVTDHNISLKTTKYPIVEYNKDYSWEKQRYWQYSFQFRDYNSNQDDDNWDEDGDFYNFIIWDDDDNYFWKWPNVFATGAQVQELYLINWVKRQRTFFRYNVWLDPYAPPGSTCDSSDGNKTFTGSWCLWNIEYLVMDGRDWWTNHDPSIVDWLQNDWVIDTWLISEKFTGDNDTIAGTWLDPVNDYWQPLFPENINVTEFSIFPHPNIDEDRAWAITDEQVNVSQYVRIHVWMKPAWRERKVLKGEPREYKYSTTINLTDIFSR